MANTKVNKKSKPFDLKYLQTFVYGKQKNNNPTLIFIHGFYIDHRCFRPLYNIFSTTYKCIAFNLPGHGDDPNLKYPIRYLNIVNMAKLITQYIIENDLKNFILIGHSLGASIAAMVNERLKNKRILHLVLMAPFSLASIPNVIDKAFVFNIKNKEHFEKLQKIVFYDYKKAFDKIDEDMDTYYNEYLDFNKRNRKYSFHVIAGIGRISTMKILNKAYKNIQINTTVFLADKDKLVDQFFASKYITTTSEDYVDIKIYKKTGHAFFVESIDEFVKDIRKIVRKCKKEKISH